MARLTERSTAAERGAVRSERTHARTLVGELCRQCVTRLGQPIDQVSLLGIERLESRDLGALCVSARAGEHGGESRQRSDQCDAEGYVRGRIEHRVLLHGSALWWAAIRRILTYGTCNDHFYACNSMADAIVNVKEAINKCLRL